MAVNHHAAAVLLVDQWAPDAPAEIKASAVELVETHLDHIVPEISLQDGGQGSVYPSPRARHPIINTAAGALLAPWRRAPGRLVGVAS